MVILGLFASCATLHPPLSTTEDHPDTSLKVTALRADPDGLHLAIQARDTEIDDSIEIWRRVEDDEWQRLQTITVQEGLPAALKSGSVEWRDPLYPESAQLTYRLRKLGDGQVSYSPDFHISWTGWPDRPTVRAEPDAQRTPRVSVAWDGSPSMSARILRRDILAGTDFVALAIVDAAAGGQFYDDDVTAGGVYSYRIQLVDSLAPVTRFGPTSEAIYVSLPE